MVETEKPIKRRYWKAKLKKREGTNETILFRAFWNRCNHIIFSHSQSFIPHAKAYKDFFFFFLIFQPTKWVGETATWKVLISANFSDNSIPILGRIIVFFFFFFFYYVYIFLKVFIPWKALVPNIIQLPTWMPFMSEIKIAIPPKFVYSGYPWHLANLTLLLLFLCGKMGLKITKRNIFN